MKVALSREDRGILLVNSLILGLWTLLILYPLFFVLIASFSDPFAVQRGEVWLFPVGFSLEGYGRLLQYNTIWTGYGNSLLYMVSGTALNVAITLPAGYALSRPDLKGRRFYALLFIFTMFFSGGLIPLYMVVKDLNLINRLGAMILPNALNVFNVLICRTFFQTTIPGELREAASLDGCSDFRFFFRIVLPLSKAIIMVMVLYYAVEHWNAYFNALIYLRDYEKYPLQIVLRDILLISSSAASDTSALDDSLVKQQRIAEMIKYCAIIVANLPLIILFPFVQKYFKKGVMIGAVKG